MIPAFRYSLSSPMPLDLNDDQNHHFFSPNHQASSSSSSLPYPILFNPDQDQDGSYYLVPKHLQSDEEGEKINIPSSGSRDHPAAEKDESSSGLKLTLWKKEDRDENLQAEDGSANWMSSKMRMMRKMMVSDQTSPDIAGNSMHKFEDQKQPLSPLGTDSSSKNYSNHSNITVRVCADCHTTKTPLWRSGPRGPKSLCNACGIRQRKARRAAAAASANGAILVAAEASVKGNRLHNKEKEKSKIECAPKLKKKRKLGAKPSRGRKKFGFEDLTLSLSNNLALHQVFPQDEKEAAILLMALSYGLVHG